MAYKYDDFIKAANNAGMMSEFSQQDLLTAQKNPEYGLSMLSLMKDFDTSQTEEQRLLAGEAANQLRKTYGTTAQTLPGGVKPSGSFTGAPQTAQTLTSAGSFSGEPMKASRLYGGQQLTGNQQSAATLPGGTKPVQQNPAGGMLQPSAGNAQGITEGVQQNPAGGMAEPSVGDIQGITGQEQSQQGAGQSGYTGAYSDAIAQALGLVGNYGDFTYGNEDAYQQLLQKILNPEAFSYDPETDPRYAAYKKTYLREGDRATANALAQASAATGGVPSSYAATAAAQAGNYYAGQVADVIPQLYEDAYNQYMNEYQMQLSGLGALQDDRSFGYQEYLDTYNRMQNNLDNLQKQDQTEYERYMDQWNMDRTEDQDAYDRALAQYEMLGYATPEIAQILGINADLNQKQILALQKAMNAMGSNIAMDGILGKQTSEAFQKLGYMDAWPAYQAMMQAGLIDAEGNYTGPELKQAYSGGSYYGEPESYYDYFINADNFFRNVMGQNQFGGNANEYKDFLETQAKSMFENGDISYEDYNKVMNKIEGK